MPDDLEPRRWFTLKQFYADPVRRVSEERNLGAHWRDAERGEDRQVSWVRGTGELIVVAPYGDAPSMLGGSDSGFVAALIIDPLLEIGVAAAGRLGNRRSRRPEVEVVAVIPDETDLDALLDGWEQARTGPDGIGWLLDRIVSLPDA